MPGAHNDSAIHVFALFSGDHRDVGGKREAALDGLVPGQDALAAGGQLVHELQPAIGASARHAARDDLEEPQLHFHARLGAGHQALRLDPPRVAAGGALDEATWIHAAKRPPLLVLARRATVRPQDVALIQYRGGDLI